MCKHGTHKSKAAELAKDYLKVCVFLLVFSCDSETKEGISFLLHLHGLLSLMFHSLEL